MKRNMFGTPRPRGMNEFLEALDEANVDPAEVNATIEHSDDDGEFGGFTAEVRFNDTGDEVFSTLGYDSLEDLRSDLRAAGITDTQEDL